MIVKHLLRYLLNKYGTRNWNWYYISTNSNITASFIGSYFRNIFPFFNDLLKTNPNINIKFIKIFEKYIITKENWENLSQNPNITLKIVKHFSNKPWNYSYILGNINITYDMLPFFEEKLDNIYLYTWLLRNKHNISLNIIEKYIDDDIFIHLLCNYNIPFEILKKYPNKPWNWENISKYTNFTMEMLEYFSNKPLNLRSISLCTKIPLDIIKNNLNKPWDLYALTLHIPLTLDIIKKIPKTSIRWIYISKFSYVTLKFFEKYYESWKDNNGDVGLNMESLSENVNISLEVIEKYSHLGWNWYALSSNKAITLEFIENHMDFKWNWYEMTKNPNITLKFIEKHIDKNWSFGVISRNPNITLEFIEKYVDRIDFDWLSENKFIYHNKLVKKKIRIQNFYYLKFKLSNDLIRHLIHNF